MRLNSSVERGGIVGGGVCVCVNGGGGREGLVQTKNLPCEGYEYIFSGTIHLLREKTLFIKK